MTDWLPYAGQGRMPAGAGRRLVEIERRGGLKETGFGEKLEWKTVKQWRFRDDLRKD